MIIFKILHTYIINLNLNVKKKSAKFVGENPQSHISAGLRTNNKCSPILHRQDVSRSIYQVKPGYSFGQS